MVPTTKGPNRDQDIFCGQSYENLEVLISGRLASQKFPLYYYF